MVSNDAWLDLHTLADGTQAVQVRGLPDVPAVALEFTLACIYNRMQRVGGGRFEAVRVGLPAARPARDAVREQAYGKALRSGYPCVELAISPDTWSRECVTADAFLHSTISHLARQKQLQAPADSARCIGEASVRRSGAGTHDPQRRSKAVGHEDRAAASAPPRFRFGALRQRLAPARTHM